MSVVVDICPPGFGRKFFFPVRMPILTIIFFTIQTLCFGYSCLQYILISDVGCFMFISMLCNSIIFFV